MRACVDLRVSGEMRNIHPEEKLAMKTRIVLSAIVSATIAAGVAFAPAAFAEDNMKKQPMAEDTMAKEPMAQDNMKKQPMAQDNMKKDQMKPNEMKPDTMKK